MMRPVIMVGGGIGSPGAGWCSTMTVHTLCLLVLVC